MLVGLRFYDRFTRDDIYVLHLLLDAGYKLAHHFLLALLDFEVVEAYVLCTDTIFGTILGIHILLGAVKKRLGRNTPHIEASSAQRFFLKKNNFPACFCGTFGSRITSRAATHNC